MRWILALVLAGCSYDFSAFGDGAPGGGSGGSQTTLSTGGASTTASVGGASVTSSTSKSASSSGSGGAGGETNPLIPPCGGLDDAFDDNIFDASFWDDNSINGTAQEVNQQMELDAPSAAGSTAQLDLIAAPIDCAFTFEIKNDAEVGVGVENVSQNLAFLWKGDGSTNVHLLRDNVQQSALFMVPNPDGLGIVFTPTQIHFLIHEQAGWKRVIAEANPPWLTGARAAVFNIKKSTKAIVDNYYAFPLSRDELNAL